MNEFLLIFRRDFTTPDVQPSPETLQNLMKDWQEWMGGIAAQNKIVDRGNRLDDAGRVVKPGGMVTNGPYVEIKEAIGGYIIIRSSSLDEAAEISQGCPILKIGGNVEVRELVPVKM
jgi:hypothetical protein